MTFFDIIIEAGFPCYSCPDIKFWVLQPDIFFSFWPQLRTLLTRRSFCPKSHFLKIFDCLQQFVRMSSRSRIPKMSPLSLGGLALHCILRRVLLPWHWIGFTIVISWTSLFFLLLYDCLFFWFLIHTRVCFSDCYFIHELFFLIVISYTSFFFFWLLFHTRASFFIVVSYTSFFF